MRNTGIRFSWGSLDLTSVGFAVRTSALREEALSLQVLFAHLNGAKCFDKLLNSASFFFFSHSPCN